MRTSKDENGHPAGPNHDRVSRSTRRNPDPDGQVWVIGTISGQHFVQSELRRLDALWLRLGVFDHQSRKPRLGLRKGRLDQAPFGRGHVERQSSGRFL